MTHRLAAGRTTSVIATGLVATSVLLAACSSGSGKNVSSTQSPDQAVKSAITNLGAQSSVKVELSLPISQTQAEQIGGTGSGPTPAEAKALTTGTVFFSLATGSGEAVDSTQAQTDPNDSFEIGLTIGSDTPIDVRYIHQNLFVQANLPQLLTDVGQKATDAATFDNELTQVNSVVPGISDLGQGKWVEVTHEGLTSLAPAFKQAESSSGTNPDTLKTDIMGLRTKALADIEANSTFASVPTTDGRDEYSVTTNVYNLLTSLAPDIQSSLGNIPDLGSQISAVITKAKAKLPPGQTAVIDLFVSSGKLSEADLDVNQFQHKYSFAIPVRAALSSPGAPSAPSGATVLDVSKLPALLGSLLNSHSSSASGSGSGSGSGSASGSSASASASSPTSAAG